MKTISRTQLRNIIAEELTNEAAPNPERIDASVVDDAVDDSSELMDSAHEAAGALIGDWARSMAPELARILQKHAMDVTHGGHSMTPGWTRQRVERLDEVSDEVMEAQQECVSDIAFELVKLAKVYARVAAATASKERDEY